MAQSVVLVAPLPGNLDRAQVLVITQKVLADRDWRSLPSPAVARSARRTTQAVLAGFALGRTADSSAANLEDSAGKPAENVKHR
jgi:hypothetical protein